MQIVTCRIWKGEAGDTIRYDQYPDIAMRVKEVTNWFLMEQA
jgi:hypothetical protein